MKERENNRDHDDGTVEVSPSSVNPGYALFQLSKALTTSEQHEDAATRERAKARIAKWETVLGNILSGSVNFGSRVPVKDVPAWATLEVVTGGFATGQLLAGGILQPHEQLLIETIPPVPHGVERGALNAYFLTDAGLADLQEKLRNGCYDVDVPEEGALLVIAWLVENGHREVAQDLLSNLSTYFDKLRFFPVPLKQPRRFGAKVHLQDVGATISSLQQTRPNTRILAQKEASEVWAPWYDRMVALFLETVAEGWPCRQYPEMWSERALALLDEYAELRKEHTLCGKPERARGHFAQLRAFLELCARAPKSLTGREVGRIRLILNEYLEKRGAPNSERCAEARQRQAAYVSGPTFHEIAEAVVPRLEKYSRTDGVDEVSHLKAPISKEEATTFDIPEATPIPISVQHKLERCLNETVQVLVERGLITSGETLARVLPQRTSGIRAAAISDPALRQLYAAIYRAFRRRRSLLLFNLQKQVQIQELPWVSAIEHFRTETLSITDLSRQVLEEVTILTVSSFPHVILPNKLLQELGALAKGAGLTIPLVDEVAADIFMGEFSPKFLEAAKRAANFLAGTLYATYYTIDWEQVRSIPEQKEEPEQSFAVKHLKRKDPFVQLCESRAGVSIGGWDAAINGMIIEQQQILTTQNLATLFAELNLTEVLRDQFGEMTRECFKWICARQQMKIDRWHARLIMLKNTAYAWRQMIFYLSLLPDGSVKEFLEWASGFLDEQSEQFRNRFRPALNGLLLAAEGRSIDVDSTEVRRFLGWSKARHWLLTEL